MSYAFYVDARHEFVLVRPSGAFTETEFIDACQAIYEHSDRKPSFTHIWDARSTDELVMDAAVIDMYRNFMAENQARATTGLVAIVATRTMVTLFARMLTVITRPMTERNVKYFSNLEAVAASLELPFDAFTDIPEENWLTSE